MSATTAATQPFSPMRFYAFIGVFVLVVVLASVSAHLSLQKRFLHLDEPPKILSQIKGDLQATERSGQAVQLSSLRGKVIVVAYIYTICPHGCAAVVDRMQKLLREFGPRPDFHLVSIAVVPERDTPEFFRAYAEGIGVKPSDPWWFITGERQRLWDFMSSELKLEPAKDIPVKERLNPFDLYEHDLRIVLVDRVGQVRGYYSVFHPEPEIASLMGEKLQNDVRLLLDQPKS
jgi:cytochrome oxidase Cu insertion factor (SCO1/SenC/PrrC family)